MASGKEFVDKVIANHKVAVFSKTYCPFCYKAKDALRSFDLKKDYTVVELENRDDCQEIQDYLNELTGGR